MRGSVCAYELCGHETLKGTCQPACQRPALFCVRFRLPKCIVALTEESLTWWDERVEFSGQGQLVDDAEQGASGGHDVVVEGVAGVGVRERGFGGGPGRLTNADER